MSGTVRRFERSDVVVDLGKYEALLPNKERVPTEEYQVGERIRCYVKAVIEQGPHGPEIILSRADPRFVLKLFQLEVSEINDGTIEIKGIAGSPAFAPNWRFIPAMRRWTRWGPASACAARVKNIVRELNNEKVDIIRWDPQIKNFITNALAPPKLKSFEIDEANRRVKILVSEDQLSLAIGKRGQNARLTSKLRGGRWTLSGSGCEQGI